MFLKKIFSKILVFNKVMVIQGYLVLTGNTVCSKKYNYTRIKLNIVVFAWNFPNTYSVNVNQYFFPAILWELLQ